MKQINKGELEEYQIERSETRIKDKMKENE